MDDEVRKAKRNAWLLVAVCSVVYWGIVFSGCTTIDINGFECCKNSYDNIDFGGNYTIVSHSSSFISGAENVYFVTYNIKFVIGVNAAIIKVHGFIYNCETDELWHDGQGTPAEIVFTISNPNVR